MSILDILIYLFIKSESYFFLTEYVYLYKILVNCVMHFPRENSI